MNKLPSHFLITYHWTLSVQLPVYTRISQPRSFLPFSVLSSPKWTLNESLPKLHLINLNITFGLVSVREPENNSYVLLLSTDMQHLFLPCLHVGNRNITLSIFQDALVCEQYLTDVFVARFYLLTVNCDENADRPQTTSSSGESFSKIIIMIDLPRTECHTSVEGRSESCRISQSDPRCLKSQ